MLTFEIIRNGKMQADKPIRSNLWFQTILVMVFAALTAGLYAWAEERIASLDIDGWGILVGRLKAQGHDFQLLLVEPSLHRGPVVPFLFGLMYYLAPFDETVILGNIVAFSIAAGCLFVGFHYLGVNRTTSASAILLWIIYIYAHKYVFGYYFAEPIVALLSSLLFVLAARTILGTKDSAAFVCGLVAGFLLLVRSPFLFVICGIPLVFRLQSTSHCGKKVVLFILGVLLIFLPWPMRNLLVYNAFVPFTTEGGQVMFQGTYLKGDDDVHNNLQKLSEFSWLEKQVREKSEIDQDQYWKALAIEQIRQDPIGQGRLLARKILRFWLYLPAHSWIPSSKTLVFGIVFLPLAAFGVWRGRRLLVVQLCTLWVCALWLFHGIVHTELRYNFPVLPMVFMLSIIGITFVVERKYPSL